MKAYQIALHWEITEIYAMKKNILLYKKIPLEQVSRLKEKFNVFCFDGISELNKHEVLEKLAICEGMIGASVSFDKNILDIAPHLKAISTISVGYDNFDVKYLTQRNIRLMHTPDVLTDTTADTIFTLLLITARRAVELSNLVLNKQWNKSIGSDLYGIDVHHKTLGILGMGRIGQALAKRAYAGFDMNILYHSNSRKEAVENLYAATYCELDELLAKSDFVCITLPLTKQTEQLISKEKLALMKPNAILINGGRGKIIDEKELIKALKGKQIRAAGLDVFEIEPLPHDSELLTLPNVVLLPHIGSATEETRYNMVKCAVDNLIMALQPDKPQKNLVNPQVS